MLTSDQGLRCTAGTKHTDKTCCEESLPLYGQRLKVLQGQV